MTLSKAVAYPVMVLAAAGIIGCVGVFILGSLGVYEFPRNQTPFLFIGVFVVWFPTVVLMNRLTRDFKQKTPCRGQIAREGVNIGLAK